MSARQDEVEEAAAAWDARLRGGRATFRVRRGFHAWLRADAGHQASYDRLQLALSALQTHANLPELSALRDEARSYIHENRRRHVSAAIMLAVAAALLLMLVFVPQTRRGAELIALLEGGAIYRTSADEWTKVTLADGSVVTLDAETRLLVKLGRVRRDITLLAGHALFEVAKDAQRPFVVKAGERTITALGTVFDVHLSPSELRVTLAKGAVAVRPLWPDLTSTERILKPHQQLVEVAGADLPELRIVDTDRALIWAEGQASFEDEPLANAVAEMNRYSHTKIIVEPSAADLRINGMFHTNNQAGFLEALQVALPVEVRAGGDGQVFVSRRADKVAD